MGTLLETRVSNCPPQKWQEWLQEQWAQLLVVAISERAYGDNECALRVLSRTAHAQPLPTFSRRRWQRASAAVLADARPQITGLALTKAQSLTAQAAAAQALNAP